MTGDDATTEELIHEKQAKSDAKEPIFDVPEILFEQKVDDEGFSRARLGNVGHNQKVIPTRVAHAIAPTTSSSTHTSSALVSNNPYGALLKGKAKHPQEKQTAAHVGKDSLVVMDGMGGVAVAVAKEEVDQSYIMNNNNKDEGELFFTDADAIDGWETVDNERRRRRNHHNKSTHKEAEQQKKEELKKEKEEEEEEEEEKPVSIDEHKLIVKSDVGLVAIAPSHPNWSSPQGDDDWVEPKKTFHHTTLQHEEKKIHPTTVDSQGNNNPYAVLQSQ